MSGIPQEFAHEQASREIHKESNEYQCEIV